MPWPLPPKPSPRMRREPVDRQDPSGQVLAACRACLQNAGVTPAVAASVAGALVTDEVEGNRLYGLCCLPALVSGRTRKRLPAALAIGADGGFAEPAF